MNGTGLSNRILFRELPVGARQIRNLEGYHLEAAGMNSSF